jgi:hypothetical protein
MTAFAPTSTALKGPVMAGLKSGDPAHRSRPNIMLFPPR